MDPAMDPTKDPAEDPAMRAVPADEPSAPFLRVAKGEPTPEELAALVTVLASRSRPGTAPHRPAPAWNAPRRLHRVVHRNGPGGWRASGLPR
jgi:hypothetical protein